MSTSLETTLLNFWCPGRERCGLILENGAVVELENIHPNPLEAFEFDRKDFERYTGAVATWHTHPRTCGNLSVEDYFLFLQLPRLWHYIVGAHEDLRCYQVTEGRVLLHDSSHPV